MSAAESMLVATAGLVFVLSLLFKTRRHGPNIDLLVGLSAVSVLGIVYWSGVAKSSSIFGRAIDYEAVIFGMLILRAAYLVNAVAKAAIYPLRVTADGDPTIPRLLQRLIGAFIYLVAFAIILQFLLDQSVTAIATASGALTLIIGYSARNVLEELFAGLALYADEPFDKGATGHKPKTYTQTATFSITGNLSQSTLVPSVYGHSFRTEFPALEWFGT